MDSKNATQWLSVVPQKSRTYRTTTDVYNDYHDEVDFIIESSSSYLDGRPINKIELLTTHYLGLKVYWKSGYPPYFVGTK